MNKVRLHRTGSSVGRRAYERAVEDYIADFTIVSRRSLDDFHYKIFRFHHLLGADWAICCAKFGLERGEFFNALYAIERKLGLVFAELKPYALYPVADYFAGRANVDDDRDPDELEEPVTTDDAAEEQPDLMAPGPPETPPTRRPLLHPLRQRVA